MQACRYQLYILYVHFCLKYFVNLIVLCKIAYCLFVLQKVLPISKTSRVIVLSKVMELTRGVHFFDVFYWKNFFFFYLFRLLVIVYANNRFKVHRIATLMLANSNCKSKKNERKRQGSERLSFKRLSKLMANARSRVPRPTGAEWIRIRFSIGPEPERLP